MKLYHLVLFFVIIAMGYVVISDLSTSQLEAVIANKSQINRSLDTALDDGIIHLSKEKGSSSITLSKDSALQSFFLSFYSSLGIGSDWEKQREMELYFPVIVVTGEDGFYVNHSVSYKGHDGKAYAKKQWSEKYPYYYEDEDFIYGFTLGDFITLYDKKTILDPSGQQVVFQMNYKDLSQKEGFQKFAEENLDHFLLEEEKFTLVRKGCIISAIENAMAYYSSYHNHIASQYGITYNFSLPAVTKEEWDAYLDDVSMFVVFQGYPFGNEKGEVYHRFLSTGAKVVKREQFLLEQKDWYKLYHRIDCPELSQEQGVLMKEVRNTEKECAKMGAFACETCIKNGVYPPSGMENKNE